MEAISEVAVTLSSELLGRLRTESRCLGVPLEYLVASLVLDTFEEVGVVDAPTAAGELVACA